ncbi:MAG TPA: hypothetical protein VF989_19880 [Polyangiaceae bacterium]
MRAAAPGKLVLSGAYAVLFGAPAIVAAVDRYAIADTRRAASFVPEEVRAALGDRPAPYLDASALRSGGHKLGLGSSAAVLVAALAALTLDERGNLEDDALCQAVQPRALEAHARAQGGGSGADVAASAHGGIIVATRVGADLRVERLGASSLCFAAFASGRPASTRDLVRRVLDFSARDPSDFAGLMEPLKSAAKSASEAYRADAPEAFVSALAEQRQLLGELGNAASAAIVTDQVVSLAAIAERDGGAVLPSGAGGGDVILFAGPRQPSAALEEMARRAGLARLSLVLGARGVHALGAAT